MVVCCITAAMGFLMCHNVLMLYYAYAILRLCHNRNKPVDSDFW